MPYNYDMRGAIFAIFIHWAAGTWTPWESRTFRPWRSVVPKAAQPVPPVPQATADGEGFPPQDFTEAPQHGEDDKIFRDKLSKYQPASWNTDVEAHADGLIQHIQKAMKEHLPLRQTGAKHIYVPDEVWQLRLQKLLCRQKCKVVRRQIGRESLRQCLRAWKGAHEQDEDIVAYNYGITLRCHQVKWYCGFVTLKRQMRKALQLSKNVFMQRSLETIDANTAASDLLRMLKPFIGPTNLKQQKKKPLPMVGDADQQPCVLPNEALAVWISFFQHMEGGRRVTPDQLRRDWIADLHELRQEEFELDMQDFPTLVDMEIALRRVPSRKAKGPDDIPGEICHFHADVLAVQMYTQLMKMALHGQEPLLYKGGTSPPTKAKGTPAKWPLFDHSLCHHTSANPSTAVFGSIRHRPTSIFCKPNSWEVAGKSRYN